MARRVGETHHRAKPPDRTRRWVQSTHPTRRPGAGPLDPRPPAVSPAAKPGRAHEPPLLRRQPPGAARVGRGRLRRPRLPRPALQLEHASYNVLFKGPGGSGSRAQIEAFDDTWHWTESAEQAFDEVIRSGNTDAAEMLRAMRSFLGENDMMAYLAMMAVRLIELHRVLRPTGSLYLHCDPTASH